MILADGTVLIFEHPSVDVVITWLETEKGNWPKIAKEAEVGYQWLTALMQGDIIDPGVRKIERLGKLMRARSVA